MKAIAETKNEKNEKIANLQFVLSILIVVIHANCLFFNLPGEELQYVYGNNYSTYIQLFFSEGIARIAVPTFFIISGYLFFNTFDGGFKSYGKKLKRRIFSLLIPYLFWSAFTFFAFFFAQKIPGIGEYFTTRNDAELTFKILFDNIIISSYNSPLWYVRYLIVFSILSIAIYWLVKKVPFVFSIIAFVGWMFNFFGLPMNLGVRWDAIFFYLLGVEIALKPNLMGRLKEIFNRQWVVILVASIYLAVQLIRTALYCYKSPTLLLNGEYDPVTHYLGNVGILLGIFAVWFGYDYIFKANFNIKFKEFSFFVFVTHHPIVNILKKLLLKLLGVSPLTSLLVYFLSIALTVTIIVAIGWVLKRWLKPVFKFICGGR